MQHKKTAKVPCISTTYAGFAFAKGAITAFVVIDLTPLWPQFGVASAGI